MTWAINVPANLANTIYTIYFRKTALIFLSIELASKGAWNPFAILEISTRILNKANEKTLRKGDNRSPAFQTKFR